MTDSPQNGRTDFITCLGDAGGQVIGKIGVWTSDEIGFILKRDYWRQGLIREALERIMRHLFSEKGFEGLSADVDPRNEGCIALLRKFGFVEVRRVDRSCEIGGVWVDSSIFRVGRNVWNARSPGHQY